MVKIDLITLGIITVFIGFILIFIGSFIHSKNKTEASFIGFIGPIPFGWGTSKEILYFSIVISLVIFILFLILIRGFKP